jgi:spermidine synthase
MLELGERAGTSWPALMRGELLLVLPWVGLPCVCLGAAFPLAARLLQRGDGGAAAGSAYAINTLGTIAGSLATGFVLLPALGVNGVLALAAALCAAVALGSLALQVPRMAPAMATLALLAGAVALAWSTPAWDPVLMSLGTYRPNSAIHLRQGFDAAGATGDPAVVMAAAQKTLFYREGINASVLVASDLQDRGRWMRVGGKIDASTGDMLTQVMLGVLPAAMADSGARTLIVGHGSGFTAAAALATGAGKTDIAELEPAVVEGSRFFHQPGTDPLDDPRVTLHLEDARTRLAHGGGSYQLIISEPTNPWIAGVNNLFTVDFYKLVRKRLASDGVFCQWIQMYELSPETFRSMLASFLSVFPDAHLFCLWRQSDVLVIAAPPGRGLSYARLHGSAVLAQLQQARMSSPDEIADFYLGSGAAVRSFVQGSALDTDDRPFVEYQAPRDLIAIGRGTSDLDGRLAAAFGRPLQPAAGGPLDAWPAGTVLTARARAQILAADADGAMRIFAQLRAMGAGDIADAVDRGFRAQAAAQAAGTPKPCRIPARRSRSHRSHAPAMRSIRGRA